MNVLKNIVGAFVEFPEDEKKEVPKQSKVPVPTPQPVSVPNIVLTDDVMSIFQNILKERNLPGPDYYEFQIMKNAMSSIPMVDVRYTSAFAGLQAQGLTKEILIASAHKYKELISQELQKMGEAYQVQYKVKVEDKKKQMNDMVEQMKLLSQQIASLNESINKLNGEITQNEHSLVVNKQQIDTAGVTAISMIDGELSNIELYIK